MYGEERATPRWILNLLWLLFLVVLALLPPIWEIHKQIILLMIALFQLLEGPFIRLAKKGGRHYSVIIKIILAAVLVNHTGDMAINSVYWPIYYLPVMTAAMYFDLGETLFWTMMATASYYYYLHRAMQDPDLVFNATGLGDLGLRAVFFFLVATIVNSFVIRYRVQTRRYRALARDLKRTNERLEKAEAEVRRAERLAALGQLSAGLAHEIRNPLGVIKGSAEILNQKVDPSNEIAKELAGYIYAEVNRLSALVGRFLDFARPSRLALTRQNLAQIIDRALKYVAEQGTLARVKVEREYDPDLPEVMIDEQLCDQVFTNLISNACEAMGETGGVLRIRIHATGGSVAAELEDSGPGVPPELREQIFNPFFTTKQSGVGLGLAIVTKIVDAHGGSVRVTGGVAGGACFQVRFPQAASRMESQPVEQQVS